MLRYIRALRRPIFGIDNGLSIKYFDLLTMARWRWVLLISGLFLFALILVLPQVDLPDTTLREGGAPVIVRAQLNSPPTVLASLPAFSLGSQRNACSTVTRAISPASLLSAVERRVLVCALLC